MHHKTRRAPLKARPLLAAGAGIAAIVYSACGGSSVPVGNLKGPPVCDVGVCGPDAGASAVDPNGESCFCPAPDAG
jgi:hypothetical protein